MNLFYITKKITFAKISNRISIKLKKYFKFILNIFLKFHFSKKYKLNLEKNNLFKPDYIDLINLYNQINKLKPKNILELGSGQSTIVIAKIVSELSKEGYECNFYSLDQEEKYLDNTIQCMPKELKKITNFFHRNLYTSVLNGKLMSFYENLPDIDFDFVYEDRRDHQKTAIAGDILLLEKRAIEKKYEFSFTIDDMFITQKELKRQLLRKYKNFNYLFSGTNFEEIK